MINNLIAGASPQKIYLPMTTTGWIIFGIATGVIVIFLAIFLYRLMVVLYKPEERAAVRVWKEEVAQARRATLEAKNANQSAIDASKNQINLLKSATENARSQAALMQEELMRQGVLEERANQMASMTLQELLKLKEQEQTDLSSDFIINAITRKVLIDSDFEVREDILDFKIPVAKTLKPTADMVKDYLIECAQGDYTPGAGRRAMTFKTCNKSFALLYYKEEGNFVMTLKCGPFYASKLGEVFPTLITKAKFPHGMLWYNITSSEECSMEIMKLLIDISYNITNAGY